MVRSREMSREPMSPTPQGETPALAVTRRAIRRWAAGEAMGDLFAPEYRVDGTPVPFQAITASSPEERRRQIQKETDIRFRDVLEGAPGHAVFEAVWVHRRDGGGGSSGLYWGVVTIDDLGRIARLRYLHDRAAAREAAGLD